MSKEITYEEYKKAHRVVADYEQQERTKIRVEFDKELKEDLIALLVETGITNHNFILTSIKRLITVIARDTKRNNNLEEDLKKLAKAKYFNLECVFYQNIKNT